MYRTCLSGQSGGKCTPTDGSSLSSAVGGWQFEVMRHPCSSYVRKHQLTQRLISQTARKTAVRIHLNENVFDLTPLTTPTALTRYSKAKVTSIFEPLDLLRKPIQILFNTFCIDALRVALENVCKICFQLFRTLFFHRQLSSMQEKS